MKLSNRKLKYIRRNASVKSPEQIAEDLGIREKDVRKVLEARDEASGSRQIIRILDRLLTGCPILMVFFAPFVFKNGIYDFANLPQLAFIQIGAAVCLGLWFFRQTMADSRSILKVPFLWPVLLFILWSFLSLIWAYNRYEALIPAMHWTASAVMGFLVLVNFRSDRHRRHLLTAIVISGGLTAMLGIVQHLFQWSPVPQVAAPAAVFANKNMAMHFIVLCFPLSIGMFFTARQKPLIWLTALFSALMIVYAIYAQTRAAWVAISVEILVLAALMFRDVSFAGDTRTGSRQKTPAAVTGAVLLCILIHLGPGGFRWAFSDLKSHTAAISNPTAPADTAPLLYSSTAQRLDIWRNTLEMIKDHFLTGVGLGNHKVYYPLYHRRAVVEKTFGEAAQLRNVHNDFIQVAAELGVIGMAMLAWLAWIVMRMTWTLTSSNRPRELRITVLSVTTALVGFSVNACFSFPLHRSIPPLVVLMLIGLLGSWYAGGTAPSHTNRRPLIWIIAGLMALTVGIGLVRHYHAALKCDHHYLNITRLEKQKNWDAVISEARRADRLNPQRVQILSYMGRALIEKGNNREGIDTLEKVVHAYPHHMNALLNLGVAYSNLNDFENARETFQKVLHIKPDYAKVHNNLGNLYIKQKMPDKAFEEFKTAARLDPTNSYIHFNVGVVAMQTKQFSEAAEAFEKTLELKPDWDQAHKYLGVMYYQFLKRPADGIVHLKKALKLNPKIKDAEKMRAIIKAGG